MEKIKDRRSFDTIAIVSAYFCEDWLEDRIRNLLEQERPVTPVIVCQDGSHEAAIARKYNDRCLLYITQDIPTVYAAWNYALTFPSNYVIIANSDDKMAKFATKKMGDFLDNNPDVGLVYADSVIVAEPHGDPIGYLDLREPDTDLLEGCYIGHYPMYRHSLHDQFGLYDEKYKIAGDYEFWLRLQKNGVKFHHLKERLGEFWYRGDNLEFVLKDRNVWESAKIKRQYGKQ